MTDETLIEPTTAMLPMATTDAKITDHKRTALRALLVPCILIVILCTSLYLYMRPLGSHDAQTTSVFMNHTSQIAKPAIDQRDRIKQELKKKLPPLFADMHTADQAALTNLHQNIQADFAMYRKNIPVFIDHTTGIGSELGLMFSFMIDGNEVAGRAIQTTFEEDVVSPEQLHRNIQSHIEAFKAQLEENRQNLMIDLSYQMKGLALPQAWQHALQGQSQQIAKQELQLSSAIAVKLAVTPIISTAGAYLAQMIAIRILAALPARVGTSILLKATKLNYSWVLITLSANRQKPIFQMP